MNISLEEAAQRLRNTGYKPTFGFIADGEKTFRNHVMYQREGERNTMRVLNRDEHRVADFDILEGHGEHYGQDFYGEIVNAEGITHIVQQGHIQNP